MTNDINPNDLDWLAFCYAAGELDAAEADQFEARLADDQSAREALARAVELTQTVAAAESQCGDFLVPARNTVVAAHAQSEWNKRLSWMAIGGLASLLLALLWSGVVGPTWQTAQRRFHTASQQNLAWAWNETRTEIANVHEAGLWPAVFTSDSDDEAVGTLQFDDTAIADAPSWMTAAVFSVPGDADSTDQSPGPTSDQRLEN
jgi:hypothetical protein